MAKKKTNLGLLAGLGAAAVVVGAGAFWLIRDAQQAAKSDAEAAAYIPKAPTGALVLVREGVTEARFIVRDEISREGDSVKATILVVGKSSTGLEGKSALIVQRKTLDCARQRIFDGKTGLFDHDGKLLSQKVLYSGKRGRLIDTEEVEAGLLCAPPAALKGRVFEGFRAAQREIQTMPQEYETSAAAQAAAPAALAWMCNAAARGRWRPEAPRDCDRAVQLNPAAADVRLDRAFLNLILGKRGPALADFDQVIAKDASNARALFARSLIMALQGDGAASKRDRAKALAIDPTVPAWIQATYGIRIGAEYRKP